MGVAGGSSTRLIVECPVRLGKSTLGTIYFAAWWLMTYPDQHVVVMGHNAAFIERMSRAIREIVREWGYLFDVEISRESSAVDEWDLARPHRGGLITGTPRNPPTGRGGDLVIVDDPIKLMAEANSATERENVWTAYSDLRTRLEPGGKFVIIMSRWHHDDLVGRLKRRQAEYDEAHFDDGIPVDHWDVLHLPALADPALIDPDPLGRQPGEALCPERYDEAAYYALRFGPDRVSDAHWNAQYQNSPTAAGGDMFPVANWRYADTYPAGLKLTRYWDLAMTAKSQSNSDPDWTVGVLLGRDNSDGPGGGYTWIVDVVRFRKDSRETEAELRNVAISDVEVHRTKRIRFPKDPGQAGKAQVGYLTRTVWKEFDAQSYPQEGDKVERAGAYSAQQQSSNVIMVRGAWNADWVEEHRLFPKGTHDDQVDAGAIGYLDQIGALRRKTRLVA